IRLQSRRGRGAFLKPTADPGAGLLALECRSCYGEEHLRGRVEPGTAALECSTMGEAPRTPPETNLDSVVGGVATEAHLRLDRLRPEERAYLKEHALKKPLRVLDVWALGVGVVVAGAYFGWNLGLKGNGPVAVLIASLLVCLLYLAWVLAL